MKLWVLWQSLYYNLFTEKGKKFYVSEALLFWKCNILLTSLLFFPSAKTTRPFVFTDLPLIMKMVVRATYAANFVTSREYYPTEIVKSVIDLKYSWKSDILARIISKREISGRKGTGATLSKQGPPFQNERVETYCETLKLRNINRVELSCQNIDFIKKFRFYFLELVRFFG